MGSRANGTVNNCEFYIDYEGLDENNTRDLCIWEIGATKVYGINHNGTVDTRSDETLKNKINRYYNS